MDRARATRALRLYAGATAAEQRRFTKMWEACSIEADEWTGGMQLTLLAVARDPELTEGFFAILRAAKDRAYMTGWEAHADVEQPEQAAAG